MLRIKKGDQVMVIAGKDKGKMGKVLEVFPTDQRALVENINLVKKARRRTQKDQQGGFMDIERPIHVSNIMLVDHSNKPSRFKITVAKDGSKERVFKESGEVI